MEYPDSAIRLLAHGPRVVPFLFDAGRRHAGPIGTKRIPMQKALVSRDYRTFLRRLREARERRGVTQQDLARRLGVTQPFISKCERGERRIDVIELRDWCRALGISLVSFVRNIDRPKGNDSAAGD